jgi:riboflavin kinase/FMN adenylyltransferase
MRRPLCLAVGVFDGVHLGHQEVITTAVRAAAGGAGVPSVLTFDPHPGAVLDPEGGPALLTAVEEKLRLLRGLGVEMTIVAEFDRTLADMQPETFVQNVLVAQLRARCVVVGRDWRFGADGSGTPALLEEMACHLGYAVSVVPPVNVGRAKVSSTRIRSFLTRGRVPAANKLLGHRYGVAGEVVPGDGLGAGIGYATANLDVPERKLLPADGVYACLAGQRRLWPAAVYVGTRPTVGSEGQRRVEVHLLRRRGTIELLGRRLRVEFVRRLREDRRFASVEALVRQMGRDCARVERVLAPLHD